MTSLYDNALRDQLRHYTKQIIDAFAQHYGVEADDFYKKWLCDINEKNKDNVKKQTLRLSLEYIKTKDGEFLYNPETYDVYVFKDYKTSPNSMKPIGKYDEFTGLIMSL